MDVIAIIAVGQHIAKQAGITHAIAEVLPLKIRLAR